MNKAPHILVVDDEDDIREPLAKYLSKNGMRVSSANGGSALREMLKSTAPNLTVLDIMMSRTVRFGAVLLSISLSALPPFALDTRIPFLLRYFANGSRISSSSSTTRICGALFITYSIDRNGLPSVEENCI